MKGASLVSAKALICGAAVALGFGPALAGGDLAMNPSYAPLADAGSIDASAFAERSDGNYLIGFSNLFSANSWVVQVAEEAKWQAGVLDQVEELILTDSEFNANKQINDIQDMLTRGVDALIVMPVSPSAVLPVLEQAREDGVVVVVIASDVDTDDVTMKILADNVIFGREGGQMLADQLNEGDEVIALRGAAGIPVETERYEGAAEVLNANGIEIVGEVFTDWAYEKGRQACEGLLLEHPNVDGVWASGGAPAQGCIEVFHELGMPLVPITGEANNGYLRTWIENEANGMVSVAPVYPASMASEAIKAAVSVLEGSSDVPARVLANPPSISQADFKDYYNAELNDSYWPPSNMPLESLKALYGN